MEEEVEQQREETMEKEGSGGEGKIKILVVTFDRIVLTQLKLKI